MNRVIILAIVYSFLSGLVCMNDMQSLASLDLHSLWLHESSRVKGVQEAPGMANGMCRGFTSVRGT